jgi:hypothetical protein
VHPLNFYRPRGGESNRPPASRVAARSSLCRLRSAAGTAVVSKVIERQPVSMSFRAREESRPGASSCSSVPVSRLNASRCAGAWFQIERSGRDSSQARNDKHERLTRDGAVYRTATLYLSAPLRGPPHSIHGCACASLTVKLRCRWQRHPLYEPPPGCPFRGGA